MSTPPNPSSASSAAPGAFPGLGAGLGFFQDWMKAASSALPGLGAPGAGTGAPGWSVPTLDPEELDKRIQELKTVQFWLEQNARMLGMTIQTMEVQRMTLQTLQGMQVPMDALRDSLKARPSSPAAAAAAVPPTASAPAAPDAQGSAAAAEAAVNPMQWWSTLTEQFSTLASQAVQVGQEAMAQAPASVSEAVKAHAQQATAAGEAFKAATKPKKPTARKPTKG